MHLIWLWYLTLVLLNPIMPCLCKQCRSKPTDLDPHCLSLRFWICINNLDQIIWLAENYKWAWHLTLFSMARVIKYSRVQILWSRDCLEVQNKSQKAIPETKILISGNLWHSVKLSQEPMHTNYLNVGTLWQILCWKKTWLFLSEFSPKIEFFYLDC